VKRFFFAPLLVILAAPATARADEEPVPPPPPAPSAPRPEPPAYGEPAPGPPREAPPPYVAEPLPKPPPFGRHGFQMAFRTGLSIPIGSAKDVDPEDVTTIGGRSSMSDLASWQIPVQLDVGGKPNKYFFLGGYVGFGFGLASGELSGSCDRLRLDCRAMSFRIGAQVHYSVSPDEWVNPWLGYGLGYTSLSVGDDGQETSFRGFDFGHFMAGLDLRVSRMFGIGPFVDFTVGKYAHRTIDTNAASVSRDIDGRSFHYWLTIGPRIVLLP
jgi:hypothetical protein